MQYRVLRGEVGSGCIRETASEVGSGRADGRRRLARQRRRRDGVKQQAGKRGLDMDITTIVQQIGKCTTVEFRAASLMDAVQLEEIGKGLYQLVDEKKRLWLVLDFTQVQFISSQAIGILMGLQKKLETLGDGKLVLCGVGPRLRELLKITKLDRLLTIKKTQSDAVNMLEKM